MSIVSCPASLSHAGKESGETRIQFLFRAPRCWRSNQTAERLGYDSVREIQVKVISSVVADKDVFLYPPAQAGKVSLFRDKRGYDSYTCLGALLVAKETIKDQRYKSVYTVTCSLVPRLSNNIIARGR